MATAQIRTALFSELTPILDSEWMMERVVNFIKSLRLIKNEDPVQKANAEKGVPSAIKKWRGSVHFTQEEIDSDEKLAAILER